MRSIIFHILAVDTVVKLEYMKDCNHQESLFPKLSNIENINLISETNTSYSSNNNHNHNININYDKNNNSNL